MPEDSEADIGRSEHRPIEIALGSLLRMAGPILPAAARISPAATVAALLVEAAINGRAGRHLVTSKMITRAAEGRDGM